MNDGTYTIPEQLRSFQHNSAYQVHDYNALSCRITGKIAEVTVGDAEDHKTKIDLRNGVLEYHDPDNPTSLGVAELLRSVGLKCNVLEGRGLRCTRMTPSKAIMVFRAIAMIPSMDRRMEHCRDLDNSAKECRDIELKFFEDTAKREK